MTKIVSRVISCTLAAMMAIYTVICFIPTSTAMAVELDPMYIEGSNIELLKDSMAESEAIRTKAHEMAELARELGFTDDSTVIQEAQKIWAKETNNIVNIEAELDNKVSFTIHYEVSTPTGLSSEAFNKMLEGTELEGFGYAFRDMEHTYGINGVFAIGVANTESTLGKHCANNNPYGMLTNSGKLIYFDDWYDATQYFGKLLNRDIYSGRSIQGVGAVYCPGDPGWPASVRSTMSYMYNKIQT